MGYTKVIQYGDKLEVYKYQNNVRKSPKITRSNNRVRQFNRTKMFRTVRSSKRAKASFIRLVHANVSRKGSPVLVTLTNYKEVSLTLGYEYLRYFTKNVRRVFKNVSHISVPEWQENGQLHFHCLFWGLSQSSVETETVSRFYQRCWARGYVDVYNADSNANGLSLYLGKYLQKGYIDQRLSTHRAYTTSGCIEKVYAKGSNTMDHYLSTVLPSDIIEEYVNVYKTPYLGDCEVKRYIIKKYDC